METHNLKQESWLRLAPETRSLMVELAMNGRTSISGEMRKYIGDRHLIEVLDTVNDINDLNQN